MPNRFPDHRENHVQSNWMAGVTAVCWISLIVLVALLSNSPTASTWVSDAAQAEMAASTMTSDAPVQIAAGKVR